MIAGYCKRTVLPARRADMMSQQSQVVAILVQALLQHLSAKIVRSADHLLLSQGIADYHLAIAGAGWEREIGHVEGAGREIDLPDQHSIYVNVRPRRHRHQPGKLLHWVGNKVGVQPEIARQTDPPKNAVPPKRPVSATVSPITKRISRSGLSMVRFVRPRRTCC